MIKQMSNDKNTAMPFGLTDIHTCQSLDKH